MSNIVTPAGKPPLLTFGHLDYGDVFQHPTGDAFYMKIQVTTHRRDGCGTSVHLGEGVTYDVQATKEVVSVASVCIAKRR